jgi:hypothetical protein
MHRPFNLVLYAFILFFFITALGLHITDNQNQHFMYLAQSFLQGKLHFLQKPAKTWVDVVVYGGHDYWHMGPGPAVLLMIPVYLFSLFGEFFYQGYLQIFLTAGTFYICQRIATKYKYSLIDSLFLALAFCFGSVYLTIAYVPWSWYFSQAITTFFLFLAIFEWHGRKRYWLIGVCIAVVLSCRTTATIGLLFFIADIYWKNKDRLNVKFRQSFQLLLPVILVGVMLMSYNYARFGNILETGYMMAGNKQLDDANRYELLTYGLFQIRNIPTNVYYYFIKTVDPIRVDHYGDFGQTFILKPPYVAALSPGAGFFVTSPIFLYVFALFKKRRIPRVVWLATPPTIVILIILLMFFWPGWGQVGPRYTLDFLPFLYLILLSSFNKSRLTLVAKTVIVASVISNFYLLVT